MSNESEIFSSRGYFWLAGDVEQMTMDSATRATLTISGRGKIELKLDKDEWKWSESSETLAVLHSKRFQIVGRLADSNQYVRLEHAFVSTERLAGPRGITVTSISAFICLISGYATQDLRPFERVNVIRIPLGPLRAWLDHPMPTADKTETGFEVKYQAEPRFEFALPQGQLAIETVSTANASFVERWLTVTQQAWIELQLNEPLNLEKATQLYFDMEDLLILLTNYECTLGWPIIRLPEIDVNCTVYCTRRRPVESTFSAIECWLLFSHIQENFGAIVQQWLDLREEFGPAFHLYLGTRRGVDLYEEHRFVNLIWGLEALHRHTSQSTDNSRAEAKIQRILGSLDKNLGARDRKWLTGILEHALEPSLADRLYATFSELPLRVSDATTRAFAKRCADRRNDISHRGGPTQRGDYNAFVLELHHLADALNHMYHAAILLRLGITTEQIEHIFFDRHSSFPIRHCLNDAGLRSEVTPPKT